MTYRQMQAMLDRIEYKPGYKLRMTDQAAACLLVEVETIDSRDPTHQIIVSHSHVVPPWFLDARWETWNEEQALEWVRGMLHRLEIHESDEWFRVDGVIRHDPHQERS